MADARRSVSDEFEKEESTPNSESEVDPRSTSFINLIVDLSENIVTDSQDFRNLISMCRHNNYIPEGQMEKIKGPLDLFEELMSRDVVNHRSDGLNVLKHLIHKSTNGNFDLIEKIQQFEDDSSTTPSSSSSASSSASSSSSSSPSTQRKLMHKSTDGYLDMIKMIKQFESLYLSSTSTTPSSVSSPSFVSSSSVSSSSSSTQTIMAEHNYNCIHRNPRLPSPTVLTWKLDLPDRFVLFDPRIDSASISFTWKWNSMDGNNSRIINPHRNLQLLSPLTIIKSMNTLISGNHFDRRGLSKFGLFIVNELIISSGVNNMFNLQGNPNEDSSSLDTFTNKVNFTMKRNINKNPDATLSPNIITREVDLMDFVDICEEEMDLFHIIFEDWWIIPYLFGFGGDSRPLIWREERMVKFLKARAKKDTEEKLVANKRL